MRGKQHFIDWLAGIRNSRLLWDALGSVYNRRIYTVISGLYDRVADDMPLSAGSRLLDAGCGRGYVALLLAQKNPETAVTGIDYSRMQVREARKLRSQRRVMNCTFGQENVMNLRFADESYDAAVSIGSIKHWPDAVRGLDEIRRVLKPGGMLLVAETDQDASDEEVRRFASRFKVWFVPGRLLFWGLRHVIFGRSFSQASLAAALEKAGFGGVENLRVPSVPYVMAKAVKQL